MRVWQVASRKGLGRGDLGPRLNKMPLAHLYLTNVVLGKYLNIFWDTGKMGVACAKASQGSTDRHCLAKIGTI